MARTIEVNVRPPLSVRLLLALLAPLAFAAACNTGSGTLPAPAQPQTAPQQAPNGDGQSDDLDEWAEMSAEQAKAVSDDVVTEEEYRSGFRRFQSCLEEAGIEFASLDESGTVIDYSYLASAGDEADFCYQHEFWRIDMSWQIANEDTSEDADAARRCLERLGEPPSEHLVDMKQRLMELGYDYLTCAENP